jgi:hypothetical protein
MPPLCHSLRTTPGPVPLAIGFGPGAQMQQLLVIAVLGGLITNMLLTRLLIPVGYAGPEGPSGSSGVARPIDIYNIYYLHIVTYNGSMASQVLKASAVNRSVPFRKLSEATEQKTGISVAELAQAWRGGSHRR